MFTAALIVMLCRQVAASQPARLAGVTGRGLRAGKHARHAWGLVCPGSQCSVMKSVGEVSLSSVWVSSHAHTPRESRVKPARKSGVA